MVPRPIRLAVLASLLPAAVHAASPDLVPDVSQLATNGTLTIVNQGKTPAGASVATIVCQKLGASPCADAPGMAAYENPAYPNAVTLNVPALPPGKSYTHKLSFWDDLDWAPGTYALTAKVDAGGSVAESDEGNNTKIARKIVLPDSVGNGLSKPGGFAAQPARPRSTTPAAASGIAAGLPDIAGTSLGFAVNGYTPWGATTVIEQPHLVKATKAGPGRNMCVIGTGLYRTFNKGSFAAGSFVDVVYRNGAPVYTRHVASLGPGERVNFQNHDLTFAEGMNVIQVKMDANNQVAESDESNTFQVKVLVKVDCNGDGKISGSTPQIKNAAPANAPSLPRRGQ